jgi:FkbM family methyltransferase
VLISVRELQQFWGVNPRTIVHVGAHNAEELEAYAQAGWGPVIWIEAQPQKASDLLKRIPAGHRIIEAAVWDTEGENLDLNIMTNTESTSLLNLGTHSKEHPTVEFSHTIPVRTKTLKNLLANTQAPEMLALDIQGVELRALKGYGDEISKVKWIYCEVNRAELYQGCALISDLDDYLGRYGFIRTATRWTIHNWGDALFENKTEVEPRSFLQRVKLKVIVASWRAMTLLAHLKRILRKLLR